MSLSSMYQLENLSIGLLEAINDKNADVQESITESLVTLGKKKTTFILDTAFQFMNKNLAKLTEGHKVLILNTIEKIVKETIDDLTEENVLQWIELASNEMIKPQENQKDQNTFLQSSASNLLVAIGKKYVKEVFGQLQKHFNPGQLPNLFIINTMANLAEINPYGVVPNLSGVLASMLPMLGMAKIDPQKCAFANAMCKFSEAILYYCNNKEKATDKSIEKSYFSTQIYAAHEIFFNVWVKTGDNRLRQTVIEAIGHFTHLMAHEKLEADLGKIVQGFLSLYKKHPDHQVISQSLYMAITAATSASPQILTIDAIFDILVKEMFAQVINCLEQQSGKNISPTVLVALSKNQNELLRCFAALTVRFSERILPFLLQKFEQNNEKMRIGTLIVLKHIINSCPEQMADKKQIVISGLRLLLAETNNRVKKNLIQIIISMAYHGYLNLEGGHLMIEFILKQCALPDDVVDKKAPVFEDCTNEQLRSSAESVLTLFSTTVENMHPVLWPQLFEYTTKPEYTRCINHVCKNLAHIAEQKRAANDDKYMIKFDQQINIPKPFEIFARLIVLCGVPLANKNRGLSILQLMKHISPNISESIVDLWDNVTPKLLMNLEDKVNNAKFNQKTWEELTMKMLSNSLDQINDEEKICEVAKAFGKQIETLYATLSDEKHFAYKCLGIVLNKTASKSTIDRQLDIIFNTMNHTNQYEREGFAVSFGYAASSHLDSVLLKLETYAKNETKKSGGGLFNILKDSGSGNKGDPEQIKSTIVLAYGYVTFYAPKDLIISRLEANILRSVSGYASGVVKELILKQNLLKSLDLITKCMHTDHLQREFNFSYKINILNQIIAFINAENNKLIQNEIKAMCFKICANIVKLNPKPTEADLFLIIKSSTDSFFALAVPTQEPEGGKKDGAKPQPPVQPVEPTTPTTSSAADPMADLTQLHGNSLYEQTATSLEDLLKTILDTDMTNQGLAGIFKHLEPWIISVNDHERLRAMRTLNRILKHYAASFKLASEAEKKPMFECFGSILGLIVSRSTDPVIAVRILTIDCIESLIKSLMIYNEVPEDQIQSDKQFEQLGVIKQKLTKADSNIMLGAVSDLSKILCKQVPQGSQLLVFIEKLIDGLLDVQSHCSSASCIFLNYCVKLRAAELKSQVDNLLRHLYAKLSLIQNQQAKLGTLRTIRVLFQQHLVDALNVFLTFPIPCNNGEIYSNKSILIHEEHIEGRRIVWLDSVFYSAMEMVEICQCLCEDEKLISEILDHLLQIWNRCLPYDEKANVKYASITPLIGTCVLNEIFANNTTASTEQVFNQNFEKLFSALLVRTSSTLNNVMPYPKSKDEGSEGKKEDPKNSAKNSVQNEYKKLDPSKISIDCFKAFIKCTQSYELFEYYEKENAWSLLGQDTTNVEGCTVLARGLCLHGEKYIPNIVNSLNSFLSAPYDCQKISVTGFFAELINHKSVINLVEQLMNNLLSKLIDTCTPVRTLCIRGLGNIASLGKEEVQKHSTTILSAMMAGLDDKDDLNDDITLESMNGLAKIIQLIDENNVRPILINILLRIRPCFEKDKPSIRASAYVLFGELARFGQGPSKEPYMEQIHSNFVSFLLHLNESDENVKRACKLVLKKVGPLMKSSPVNDLFQATLIENKSLHYGEFINDLSKLLVNEFPDKVSFYIMNSVSNFKSQWNEIRCNAVLFAGYLLGHLSKDKQSVLSKEHITNALIKLVKEDPSPAVKQKAAEAISLLHEF